MIRQAAGYHVPLLLSAEKPRLLDRTSQIAKRAFDIAAAGLGSLVLLPLIAILYLLVRATSPGPAFYRHTRIGRHGRPFVAWKFRTMLGNSDALLRRSLDTDPDLAMEWGRDRKLKRDPRITSIGRMLRRTSLDELPQLWNILRGDMSLVGPRPIVAAEVEKYGVRYRLYQTVRPGLTGLWQVSGRNNTTYGERVEFDEYYVRNWSIWLDAYILGRTLKVVLSGEGAY